MNERSLYGNMGYSQGQQVAHLKLHAYQPLVLLPRRHCSCQTNGTLDEQFQAILILVLRTKLEYHSKLEYMLTWDVLSGNKIYRIGHNLQLGTAEILPT